MPARTHPLPVPVSVYYDHENGKLIVSKGKRKTTFNISGDDPDGQLAKFCRFMKTLAPIAPKRELPTKPPLPVPTAEELADKAFRYANASPAQGISHRQRLATRADFLDLDAELELEAMDTRGLRPQ